MKDIFAIDEPEWPGARAWSLAGKEAMDFAAFLLEAGFSDDEAVDIGIAASSIESPEEAVNFVESVAKANGHNSTVSR